MSALDILLIGWSALMAIFALAILIIVIPADARDRRKTHNG